MRTPKTSLGSGNIIDDILDSSPKCGDVSMDATNYNPPSRAYSVNDPNALNDFAKVAHEKLSVMVEGGKARAGAVITKIMNEIPVDYIRPADLLGFGVSNLGANTELLLRTAESAEKEAKTLDMTIHRNALGQLSTIGEVPMTFINTLLSKGSWGAEELAQTLRVMFGHLDSRHLLRVVKGEVRGVLSDKYRRLNSPPARRGLR